MNIKIDTSKVSGISTGSEKLDKNTYDTWYYKDLEFMSGKIYGLISEYGQGCMYLSYLLGGNVDFGPLKVLDDNGAIVVLPVGSDTFIKNIVDECIYLDPKYLL